MDKNEVTKIEYSEGCRRCGKIIRGKSEKEVKGNMRIHRISKECNGKEKSK